MVLWLSFLPSKGYSPDIVKGHLLSFCSKYVPSRSQQLDPLTQTSTQQPTLEHIAIKSHRHYALVYADRRLSRLLFKVDCRQMEQLVGLVRWLRKPTKSMGDNLESKTLPIPRGPGLPNLDRHGIDS
jgi:hypothetical protein